MNVVTINIGKVAISFAYKNEDTPIMNVAALMQLQAELNAEITRVGAGILADVHSSTPSSIAPG